jgi:hypothetical protein
MLKNCFWWTKFKKDWKSGAEIVKNMNNAKTSLFSKEITVDNFEEKLKERKKELLAEINDINEMLGRD